MPRLPGPEALGNLPSMHSGAALGEVGVELREATTAEFLRIYGEAEHVVAAVDGEAVAWAAFREIDGRVWGMFGVLDDADPAIWRSLFYAFRRHLRARRQRVFVLARDQAAERLIRLVGLVPTHEIYAEKRVWLWQTPHRQ